MRISLKVVTFIRKKPYSIFKEHAGSEMALPFFLHIEVEAFEEKLSFSAMLVEKSEGSKSCYIQTIYAIFLANWAVTGMARNRNF